MLMRPLSSACVSTTPTAAAQKRARCPGGWPSKRTKALAKVACPQKEISFIGENQRISWACRASLHTRKEVSDRLFSDAMP